MSKDTCIYRIKFQETVSIMQYGKFSFGLDRFYKEEIKRFMDSDFYKYKKPYKILISEKELYEEEIEKYFKF